MQNECKYCQDEICVNVDCPLRADYCPIIDTPDVCKWEDRRVEMQNDMRDRLVELLQEYTDNNNGGGSNHGRADHLIANGVQEVKRGNWIYNLTYYESDECNCSLCGQLMTTAKGVRMNYCPNCGAKMDGGKNE